MLNEQLKKQIRNEATSSAANFHYYPGSEQFEDMETAYEIGAFKYAEKWQQAQQLVERYEKVLKAISEWKLPETGRYWDREKTEPMSYEVCHGSSGVKEYFMKLATEALTPKTGSDE